jgi:flagellar biosynthetic protein FliS
MYARAARSYRNVYLESASPARLIEEMYARLERDLDELRTALADGDVARRGAAASHALAVVGALASALDRKLAPELCDDLGRLYCHVMACITRANIHGDGAALVQAEGVLRVLRDGFQQAAQRI